MKSSAGNRVIALPDDLVRELREFVTTEGIAEQANALVFVDAADGPIDFTNWRRRIWLPARKRAQLPDLQFHDLRRTNATVLAQRGVDAKTSQGRLGHSDIRLTLGVYAQRTTAADRAAAESLGDALYERPRDSRGMHKWVSKGSGTHNAKSRTFTSRGAGIRTRDLSVPKA